MKLLMGVIFRLERFPIKEYANDENFDIYTKRNMCPGIVEQVHPLFSSQLIYYN